MEIKELLGLVGTFLVLGWGALAHIYHTIYSMPQKREFEEMNRRVTDIFDKLDGLNEKLQKLEVRMSRDLPRRRPQRDED